MRRLFLIGLMISFVLALNAQEIDPGLLGPLPSADQAVFPAGLLLEAADYALADPWQPDWPLYFPPDTYRPVTDDWVSITIRDNQNEYSLKRDGELLLEFPWFYQGVMRQIRLEYTLREDGEPQLLKFLYLDNYGFIEVLEYSNGSPYLLRICREGEDNENSPEDNWFFVYCQRTERFIFESWYDPHGTFLEQYVYSCFPASGPVWGRGRIISCRSFSGAFEIRRDFDSRYLVTGISGSAGDFAVYYVMEDLPRYWKQQVSDPESILASGNFSLQWDKNGLLVRLSGEPDANDALDSRYEYILDERGNWIERREVRMIRNKELLVPAPGISFTRVFEYGNSE